MPRRGCRTGCNLRRTGDGRRPGKKLANSLRRRGTATQATLHGGLRTEVPHFGASLTRVMAAPPLPPFRPRTPFCRKLLGTGYLLRCHPMLEKVEFLYGPTSQSRISLACRRKIKPFVCFRNWKLTMPPLQISRDKQNPQDWRVEDTDTDGDGAPPGLQPIRHDAVPFGGPLIRKGDHVGDLSRAGQKGAGRLAG